MRPCLRVGPRQKVSPSCSLQAMSSLLEEWADVEQKGTRRDDWDVPPSSLDGDADGALVDDGAHDLLDDADASRQGAGAGPLLSVETLERRASHGQGDITALAAAANCVLLGTATGALIRYDFAEGAATGGSPACTLRFSWLRSLTPLHFLRGGADQARLRRRQCAQHLLRLWSSPRGGGAGGHLRAACRHRLLPLLLAQGPLPAAPARHLPHRGGLGA